MSPKPDAGVPQPSPIDGLLLTSARRRLQVAGLAVLVLWGAVGWAVLATSPTPPQDRATAPAAPSLRLVVAAGQAAPTGGTFDRFDVTSQPIVAPVNVHGHVAFYASVVRSKQTEGLFANLGPRIVKLAAVGDAVPGGGTLSELARHPIPALNDGGKVAFGAAIAGARASEGVFVVDDSGIKAIALSGNDAPGILTGTFAEFDAPALNNRDEVTFVATVRRGRETLQVLYLYSAGKLRKLVTEGDPLPIPASPTGDQVRRGTFAKFGVPVINNKGVVVFPAVVDRGAVLGGIFVTGTRDLRLLVAAGETGPSGAMLVRFSERVALDDDDDIAFTAHLGTGVAANSEAVFLWSTGSLTQVAAVGDSAPGGGRFSAFGPWPTLAPGGTIAFVAGIDDGPGSAGLYVARAGDIRRLAMAGDLLPDGTKLSAFALNPIASAGPNGGVTFATMAAPDAGRTGIYYFGPPPSTD
jgi:hypothetical protein